MKIYVGGSLREVPRDPDLCRAFVAALGVSVVKRGHVLLTGCRSTLDQEIARAAEAWLSANDGNPKDQIISYCLESDTPVHMLGTLRRSALTDWGLNHSELVVPEQIDQADATLFVAGSEGTFWAKNWAHVGRKLILGIPRFGGAGQTIYTRERTRRVDSRSTDAEEYEALNVITNDMAGYADHVVTLVERLVLPRTVFTIMSFKPEFIDVFDSCQQVCQEYGLEAERTDESASSEPILPRMLNGIRNSAFVIADLSELSCNVFYEVGYAKGLGKEVILIARKGTELPFDLKDLPTLFWETQRDLKKGLEDRIDRVVSKYGR